MTDTVAPVITCDVADGNWHGANVSIACTAVDAGSGLANAADAALRLEAVRALGDQASPEARALLMERLADASETDGAVKGAMQAELDQIEVEGLSGGVKPRVAVTIRGASAGSLPGITSYLRSS